MVKESEKKDGQQAPEVVAPVQYKSAHIYQAIHAVADEMSKIGISKGRTNKEQGFAFRGIEDVYRALSPLLVKHGIVVLPRVVERDRDERITKSGGTLAFTAVTCDFVFLSVVDGSSHEVRMYGEGMDSGDKSTPKALSNAYKYACFQAFCIPTEGLQPDADEDSHQVGAPSVFENDDARNLFFAEAKDAFEKAMTESELKELGENNKARMDAMKSSKHPYDKRDFKLLRDHFAQNLQRLKDAEKEAKRIQEEQQKLLNQNQTPEGNGNGL